MTLLERETLVDRPELIDRNGNDEESNEDEEPEKVSEGGPIVHGLEFSDDDLDVVAGANACAALTTGSTDGDVFTRMFKNAAVQLKNMKDNGMSLERLSLFGVNSGVGSVGLSSEDTNKLMSQLAERDQEEQPDDEEADESDIENIEQEVDNIQEDGE
mgnify:CR=1 FL=1